MTEAVERALTTERTIDITTTGRHSGRLRRIEMWFHNVDGRIYLTGTPGRRDWYANLVAHPRLTFHLKQSVRADLPATARPITDRAERHAVLAEIVGRVTNRAHLDGWVARSPLVEIVFDARD